MKIQLNEWRARGHALPAFICLLAASLSGSATADVRVLVGPTPIVHGDAVAAGDITVVNERLAFALAVQSAVPYGVPRGALVDLAPVVDGVIGRDRVVFADFIPNDWSAWPSTYQHVEILERGPRRAVIRATRDWGSVTIATTYTLESDSDHVELHTLMTNGGTEASAPLLSGLTLWPNSGFLFGVPGLQGVAQATVAAPLAHRVVAYDEDWAIALHAGYFDHVGDDSRDLYLRHTLRAGESRSFDGWLQVRASGDLAPIVAAEIEHDQLPSGRVRGEVRARDGGPVERPVVVVEKLGKPYAWVVGRDGTYDITLPPGHYDLYATAKNHSQSGKSPVNVTAGSAYTRNFGGLQRPGSITFEVTDAHDGKPLDARLSVVQGQKPVVEFLGRQTFFTELDARGRAEIPIAPGPYVFEVTSGGGFLGPALSLGVSVVAGGNQVARAALVRLFDPPGQGWYGADLHHHGDQAEAVTPPADLARSQLAAGLDLLFVSDHDSTANHRVLQDIADRRGVPFIPAIELSASWGHFNAYPWALGESLGVDTSVATVQEIFGEARRHGAIVVQVNHPFIPYGYLTSVAGGVAPGGFDPAFDLLEINDSAPEDDDKVLHSLWDLWSGGHHYYLTAGTDNHDVWNSESGHVRTYAHVAGPLTAAAFATSLRAGHGYVTRGPLILPKVSFGEELKVRPGEAFTLTFDFQSVDGMKLVQLVSDGAILEERSWSGAPRTTHTQFELHTLRPTWYALVVQDDRGRRAYSDPIWVDVLDRVNPD